jgi:radical SAM superfamily enzyme YgiQ (UPF0313 family)
MKKYHGIIFTDSIGFGTGLRPLGAYCIANELRSHGYNILVINYLHKIDFILVLKLLEKFISEDTLFLGYSTSLFPSTFSKDGFLPIPIENFQSINTRAKAINPKLKIIFGGANSKRLTGYNLGKKDSLGVDYVMHGYSEQMIIDFVKNLENNLPQNTSKSIYGLGEIEYDHTGKLFNFQQSKHTWVEEDLIGTTEALPLEVARGCIFKCKFCAYPLLGKNPKDNSYIKLEENLREEIIENYQKFKTTTYFIVDDTFNERTDKIEMMLRIRDSVKLDLNFVGYNRLDLISRRPEQLGLLKQLNFDGMFFGIESMNYESAKSIGKGLRPEEIKDTLYRIKSEFPSCSITGGFIIGLPHETRETLDQWMPWVIDRNAPIDSISVVGLGLSNSTHTQSEFASNPEKYGYIPIDPYGGWKSNTWTSLECQTMADKITQDAIDSGRSKVPVFMAVNMLKLDYNFEYLKNLPMKDLSTNDMRHRMRNFVSLYVQKLLSM